MTARRDGKSLLFGCETKHEITREAIDIALDLLVERLGGNPVEICQVGVKHDALSPDDEDPALYRIMALEFHDLDSCARSRQTWSQSVTTCFRVHVRDGGPRGSDAGIGPGVDRRPDRGQPRAASVASRQERSDRSHVR